MLSVAIWAQIDEGETHMFVLLVLGTIFAYSLLTMPCKIDRRSADQKPITKFAMRVPKPKQTGTPMQQNAARLNRDALIRIVDACIKFPKRSSKLYQYMISNDLDVDDDPASAADDWTGSYNTFKDTPKTWWINCVMTLAKKHNIAIITDVYMKALAKETFNFPIIMELMTQIPWSIGVPEAMQDMEVANKVVLAMAAQHHNRLCDFAHNGGFEAGGNLNLGASGCAFTLVFVEDAATEVIHFSGARASIPATSPITKDFKLIDNHMDFKARALLGPSDYFLHSFFAADVQFKKSMYTPRKKWQFFEDLVDEVDKAMQESKSQRAPPLAEQSVAVTIMGDARKEKNKENLAKAGTKLAERATKRKLLRESDIA
jgi:hypothetical protein